MVFNRAATRYARSTPEGGVCCSMIRSADLAAQIGPFSVDTSFIRSSPA